MRGKVIALRCWFWVALVLCVLWLPVLLENTLIDPPADLVTKRVTH